MGGAIVLVLAKSLVGAPVKYLEQVRETLRKAVRYSRQFVVRGGEHGVITELRQHIAAGVGQGMGPGVFPHESRIQCRISRFHCKRPLAFVAGRQAFDSARWRLLEGGLVRAVPIPCGPCRPWNLLLPEGFVSSACEQPATVLLEVVWDSPRLHGQAADPKEGHSSSSVECLDRRCVRRKRLSTNRTAHSVPEQVNNRGRSGCTSELRLSHPSEWTMPSFVLEEPHYPSRRHH